MIMSRPTRSEFRQSRFYRCALAFNKRYDERLEHIRSLLEKINEKTKRDGPARTKGYVSTWQISDDDGGSPKGSTSKEDLAILAADKNDTEWVYNPSDGDYVFSVDGMIVMRLPLAIYERLKPFQRDAVKWIGCVGTTGGILGDDMGMGKTVSSFGCRLAAKLAAGRKPNYFCFLCATVHVHCFAGRTHACETSQNGSDSGTCIGSR